MQHHHIHFIYQIIVSEKPEDCSMQKHYTASASSNRQASSNENSTAFYAVPMRSNDIQVIKKAISKISILQSEMSLLAYEFRKYYNIVV